MTNPNYKTYFIFSLVVIILDQFSKYLIHLNFFEGERLSILPFFDITLAYNKGAAWSFLSDAGGWQRWLFTLISFVVSIVLIVWIVKADSKEKIILIALSLILGGAIGNLIDRILLGQVIDFILIYYQSSYFPIFNVADIAISLGAFLLILDTYFQAKKK